MLSSTEWEIPINKNNNFIIKKSNWLNSVDIIIKDGFNFNVLNLYFIFRSYFRNKKNYVQSLYLCVNTKDLNNYDIYTYKKIESYSLGKITFFEFMKWLKNNLESEKEYLIESNFYGFKIIFYEFSTLIENDIIYPIYPWIDPYYDEIKHMSKIQFIDI
jgi:hypothetical protein